MSSKQKLNLTQLAAQTRKKIDSPLAKYSSTGQLFCVLCNTQVKNEIYWTGHINGKAHKENVTNLKKSSSTTAPQSQQSVFKRPFSADNPPGEAPQTPPKKIQKIDKEEDDKERSAVVKAEEELKLMMMGGVSNSNKEVEEKVEEIDSNVEKPAAAAATPASLPQGFFDDPKEDARVRGMKFKDPQDVEWDKFVKEIATEDIRSSELIGVEQEKSAVERELDHIEEQMAQWQRVVDLEKKAIDYASKKKHQGTSRRSFEDMDVGETNADEIGNEDEDDDDEDYDEELDWRNKKR